MMTRRACHHGLIAFTAALLTLTASSAAVRPASQKLDRALRERIGFSTAGQVRVIVRAQPRAVASVHQVLVDHREEILSEQPARGTILATVRVDHLAALARHASVDGLSLDAPVQSMDAAGSQVIDLTRTTLGVGTGLTGTGVGIAIIDSGFAPAAADDFETSPGRFFDFTTGSANPPAGAASYDHYGHGTHVGGLIASDGSASLGQYPGVAPGAKLIIMKVLDQNGQGFTSDVVNAINYAVSHKQALGIDIINLSLGHPIYEPAATDPLVQAVERAVRAGIVVVAAAGNNGGDPTTHVVGYAGINSPGNAPSAITVGTFDMAGTTTRSDDTIPWYSSRGPSWYDAFQKPDLVAPGHRMVSDIDGSSTLYTSYPQSVVSVMPAPIAGKFLRLSGTSMSAAVVSGAAALVIKTSRTRFGASLPPNAIKALLQYSAIPMNGYDALTQGAGALNIAGALVLAKSLNPAAPAGASWSTSTITPFSTIAGKSYAWGQRLVWGDRMLSGTELYTNSPAWATRVVWGDRAVWGDRVVWGESTVWSADSRVIWGERVIWGDSVIGTTNGSRVIWGDRVAFRSVDASRVIWGDVSQSTLAGLITSEDPFGFSTLQGDPQSAGARRDRIQHGYKTLVGAADHAPR